jgi:hypothetical protein
MTAQETASYIARHLQLAGRSGPLFTDDATALIHATGRGLPGPSATSPSRPSSPPTPAAKPSSAKPAPAPPLPRSRQTDRQAGATHTKAPRNPAGGVFACTFVLTVNDAAIINPNVGGQGQAETPGQPRLLRTGG